MGGCFSKAGGGVHPPPPKGGVVYIPASDAFVIWVEMHYGVHSRPDCISHASAARLPQRRPRVGRASAACGRFGEWSQRSLRCVGRMRHGSETWKFHTWLEIPSAFAGGTVVKPNTIGYVTSFGDLPRSIGRTHYELLCVGRTRRPQCGRPHCVGRNASAARRPQCGRLCTDL